MKLYNIYLSILTVLFSVTFVSCDKSDNIDTENGVVELYLLDSYETVDNTQQIIISSVITESDPLIKYNDFLSYDSGIYMFKISDHAKDIFENLEDSIVGKPFAIKANNDIIYTGYFWPSYYSSLCYWVIVDPTMIKYYDGIKIEIGYPGLINGQSIPDNRNDIRILEIFEKDNKLI